MSNWNTTFAEGDALNSVGVHQDWDDAIALRYRVMGTACPPSVGTPARLIQSLNEGDYVFGTSYVARAQQFVWDYCNKLSAEFELEPTHITGSFTANPIVPFVPPAADLASQADLRALYWAGGQHLFTEMGLTFTINGGTRYGFRRFAEAKISSLTAAAVPVLWANGDADEAVANGDYGRFGAYVYQAVISGGMVSWVPAANTLGQCPRILEHTLLRQARATVMPAGFPWYGATVYDYVTNTVWGGANWVAAQDGDLWGTHLLNDLNAAYNKLTRIWAAPNWNPTGASSQEGLGETMWYDSTPPVPASWDLSKTIAEGTVWTWGEIAPTWKTLGTGDDHDYVAHWRRCSNNALAELNSYVGCSSNLKWFTQAGLVWSMGADSTFDAEGQPVLEGLFSLFSTNTGAGHSLASGLLGPASGIPTWCDTPNSAINPNGVQRGAGAFWPMVLVDFDVSGGFRPFTAG